MLMVGLVSLCEREYLLLVLHLLSSLWSSTCSITWITAKLFVNPLLQNPLLEWLVPMHDENEVMCHGLLYDKFPSSKGLQKLGVAGDIWDFGMPEGMRSVIVRLLYFILNRLCLQLHSIFSMKHENENHMLLDFPCPWRKGITSKLNSTGWSAISTFCGLHDCFYTYLCKGSFPVGRRSYSTSRNKKFPLLITSWSLKETRMICPMFLYFEL